jgi:lipopolysaccharide/colanic/teichoic acid biosynthesis glycosyltransferase
MKRRMGDGVTGTRRAYRLLGKRALDTVVAAVALVLAAPAMLAVAVAVRLTLGSPVLFWQRRPGLLGEPFLLLKFRTMRAARDAAEEKVSDAGRLTPLGRWLRSSSLDELPELWNVLRGDISLVGPRPLLMEYLPLYSPEQARRHEVRPGMTGLAQVSGRNALTWEEKFRLDVSYVEHYSLPLDVKLLVQTIRAVVTARGISAEGSATMPRFTGSRT